MLESLEQNQLQIAFQLLLALVLGGLVGLEREFRRKEAGLKTYALVSLGSALFTIVGLEMFRNFSGEAGLNFDPSHILQAIAIGIGFIGGGAILRREFHVEGLTTAAGLWIVAAIGAAVGSGLYITASIAAVLVLVVLTVFRSAEEMVFGAKKEE